MTACHALKEEAGMAFAQLSGILAEVPEGLSWAQIKLAPGSWLNTNGTIIGMIQHVAVCKFMYGSTAFRETEMRWRTCFDQLEAMGASWQANLDYLAEAHQYWLSTWANLKDSDLDSNFTHFRGVKWPGWKVIETVTQHDVYHAGQVALLASALVSTDQPPDLRLDEERKCVMDLPGW